MSGIEHPHIYLYSRNMAFYFWIKDGLRWTGFKITNIVLTVLEMKI